VPPPSSPKRRIGVPHRADTPEECSCLSQSSNDIRCSGIRLIGSSTRLFRIAFPLFDICVVVAFVTMDSESDSGWAVVCCAAVSFQLFRMSIDLIQTASQATTKDYKEDHHGAVSSTKTSSKIDGGSLPDSKNYGSIVSDATEDVDKEAQEETALLPATERRAHRGVLLDSTKPATWSFRFQCILVAVLVMAGAFHICSVLPMGLVWSSVAVVAFSAILTYRDVGRARFGVITRIFYLAASLILCVPLTVTYYKHRGMR
jgi:hypothetical protein